MVGKLAPEVNSGSALPSIPQLPQPGGCPRQSSRVKFGGAALNNHFLVHHAAFDSLHMRFKDQPRRKNLEDR
jgi:hypothetical protein